MRLNDTKRLPALLWAGFFICGLFVIGNVFERTNTFGILLAYFLTFLAFIKIWNSISAFSLLALGIIGRLILFISLPNLSDDFYRFIWDAFLFTEGHNPFNYLPIDAVELGGPGADAHLLAHVNSPTHYTCYPPLHQLPFVLGAYITSDWFTIVAIARVIFLAAEIGSYIYLKKILTLLKKPQSLAFLYFLNPLIILEGVGNLHFEILVIFLLVLSIYSFYKSKPIFQGLCLGLAVGVKLIPALFGPAMFFHWRGNKKFYLALSATIVVFLTLHPILFQDSAIGMAKSLALYFNHLEFNAPIYLILKKLVLKIWGYGATKKIATLLSVIAGIAVVWISAHGPKKGWRLEQTMLYCLTVYLLSSATVHPWYILPLVALGLLAGYIYPMVWSLLIFVTYLGYSAHDYALSLGWIVSEYLLVGLAFLYNNQLKSWLKIPSSYL
jgi:alpha-1,6-mannosyltransferase